MIPTAMHPAIASLLAESRDHERAGNLAPALQLAEQALALARQLADPDGLCGGLAHAAVVYARQGDCARASQLAGQALTYANGIADSARACIVLGGCAAETHDLVQAEEMFRRSADLSRSLGFEEGLLLALHNLADDVYIPRGQFSLALDTEREAYRIGLKIGSPINLGWALNRAVLCQVMGRRDEARQALAQLKTFAHWRAQAVALIVSARLALDEENWDGAAGQLHAARGIAERVGHPRTDVWLRNTLSRLERLRGDGAAARAWAGDALAIARRAGQGLLEGEALLARAEAGQALGDFPAAQADLLAARTVLAPLGADYHLALAALLEVALHVHQQRPADAAWLEAAQRITFGGYEFLLERERRLAFPLMSRYARSPNPALRAATEKLLHRLARVPPLPLHIVGLGRFQVRQGHQALPERAWDRRRAGQLFRFLLLQPHRSAQRETVFEALWPDRAPESAEALFHQATSALRRVLEPDLPDKFRSRYLLVEGERLELQLPSGSTVDAEVFEAALARALAADALVPLQQALDLYTGDQFPQDRYVAWAAARREHLAQLELRGLQALAERCLAAGRPVEALEVCRRLLLREPWLEQAVWVGMRACLVLNDRPGALRLYRALETTLLQELELAPRQDLQDLAQSILRQPSN